MSLPSIEAFTAGNFFSAATAAFTKKDMKPSFTPYCFSNFSLYLARKSIIGFMFTSLNVVRMAFCDWDCSRRSATRWRRRLIGTRCSTRSPSGTATAGAAAALGAAAGIAATSSFSTRPSRPEPCTPDTSTPFSAASLAAAGMATPACAPAAATWPAGSAAGAWAAAGAASAVLASVSILANSWPAVTVAPSCSMISTITPACWAGSSSTTLSVSRSIRFSSRFT